ncbi:MAG TPA: hypothetical protein VNO14_12620 [Blastocatellia bacterium]|nr:hypothetical protein [Blastocatellia bacterium]
MGAREHSSALSMRATRVGVCGFSSNAGKTTLLCDLLRRNPGWEAIKVSRGHYRSCGKSREACCISHLLGGSPVVLTGRSDTFEPGKDTGRYWEAGASNVHWVICTDEQVEEGLNIALGRVEAEGVFIEGTSFLKYIPVDYSIMVVNPSLKDIKSSASRVVKEVSAIYSSATLSDGDFLARLRDRLMKRGSAFGDVPVYDERDLPRLVEDIRSLHRALRVNG